MRANKTQLEPKPFVFRLSEILRIYVQRRFKMPAMELTGEEFIVEIVSNPFFSGNYEKLLREFVNLGDRVNTPRRLLKAKLICFSNQQYTS